MDGRLLPQLVAQHAQECPERVYIQHVDGDALTFGQLHHAALRWAAAYRSAGVDPGDRVLTMMSLSLDFYCSALGLAWVLGIEVPVNIEYRGLLLLHALRSAQPQVIITQAEFVDRFEEVANKLKSRPVLVIVGSQVAPEESRYTAVTVERFLADGDPLTDLGAPIHGTSPRSCTPLERLGRPRA